MSVRARVGADGLPTFGRFLAPKRRAMRGILWGVHWRMSV